MRYYIASIGLLHFMVTKLIRQSGNCYHLALKCHISISITYWLTTIILIMGRTRIRWNLVPWGMVKGMGPIYYAGNSNYWCENCALRCCSCSDCTCSSSSLIRRSLLANFFLKSFSSSHCREYALCNWNTKHVIYSQCLSYFQHEVY
jgi:hypothetical protein